MRIVTPNRNLGTVARLSRRSTNLNKPRRNFWYFQLKEPLDKAGVRSAHDDLGTLRRLSNFHNVRLKALAMLVVLVGNLLGLGHERFYFAKIQQGVAVISLLNNARDNVTFAACVLVVLHVPLYFTDSLHDHLFGSLSGDATKIFRGVIPLAYHFAVLIELLTIDPDISVIRVNRDHSFFG